MRPPRKRALTDEQVREIRLRWYIGAKEDSARAMASEFGVSNGVIQSLLKRKTYKGLEPDLTGVETLRPPHIDDVDDLDWIAWLDDYRHIYAVTLDGRIASYHKAPRWMNPGYNPDIGYRSVALHVDGGCIRVAVGRLVYAAFGDQPMIWDDGTWCVHRIDGNPSNDHIDNLKLMPVKDLYPIRRERGTDFDGERHPQAKLTQAQVDAIRLCLKLGGVTQAELAQKFGVGDTTISAIAVGDNWSSS